MYSLALSSALRLSELLRLDVTDVLADPAADMDAAIRIRSSAYLTRTQATWKGGRPAAGDFVIGRRARAHLIAYLREYRRRGWVDSWTGAPLFITTRGRWKSGHARLAKTTAQHEWKSWQRTAAIGPYRWHDLRHTAISKFAIAAGGNVYNVAAFARHADVRNSAVYVHQDPDHLARIAEDL